MCIFKRKPKPDMIDLVAYEKVCQLCVQGNIPIPPVIPPPANFYGWTEKEIAMMKDNRSLANIIYGYYRRLSKRG